MRFKLATFFVILVALASGAMLAYIFLQKGPSATTQAPQATVSGIFDVNGVIPSGASITLTQKEYYSGAQPSVFASNLPVVDKSPWSFAVAGTGKTYEIQAQVIVNGVVVASSSPLDVTAPADEEVLALNIEAPQQQPVITAISGTVTVNGYIPEGSTITVQGRKLGAQKFTTIAQGLPGQTRQALDYTKALSGTTYEVQGTLLDTSGQVIGTSNILTVTAPASNEVLVLNSSALAPTPAPSPTPVVVTQNPLPTSQPTPPVAISGSINFNGAAPVNSRIVLFQKLMNDQNYQVALDNISPADGTTWQWNAPKNSTWYTLIAILKQRQNDGTDKDIATSVPTTIAAPAVSVVMTINSGFSLSAPGGPISISCQTYNGGPNQNTWNVGITFQAVNGAGSYWYQVGSTNGGTDLINSAGQSNTINTTIKNSTTYYARYAYASAAVAPLGSNQYSGFSSTTPLQCSH